jgi:hypothetical protein
MEAVIGLVVFVAAVAGIFIILRGTQEKPKDVPDGKRPDGDKEGDRMRHKK